MGGPTRMLSPRLGLGLGWGVGRRLLRDSDPSRRGWHARGLILHPLARRDGTALRVSLGRCWALNENMAYWWIIRIPILLASLVGGHPPAPHLFGELSPWLPAPGGGGGQRPPGQLLAEPRREGLASKASR